MYRNKTRKVFDNCLTSYSTNLYQRYFVPNSGNHKNYQILRKIHDHFNVLLLQVSEKENKSDIIDEVWGCFCSCGLAKVVKSWDGVIGGPSFKSNCGSKKEKEKYLPMKKKYKVVSKSPRFKVLNYCSKACRIYCAWSSKEKKGIRLYFFKQRMKKHAWLVEFLITNSSKTKKKFKQQKTLFVALFKWISHTQTHDTSETYWQWIPIDRNTCFNVC